jgi:hypothetical protein
MGDLTLELTLYACGRFKYSNELFYLAMRLYDESQYSRRSVISLRLLRSDIAT